MSSDPASYIANRAATGRRIALTLRGPLHEHPTSFDLSRDEALKLLSGLSQALFATASHDPRPVRQAAPVPVTDNDEIDAIVGALAALTDRVSALEEDTEIGSRLVRLEAHASIARQNFKTGKERLDDIDARLQKIDARITHSAVTPAPERASNPDRPATHRHRKRGTEYVLIGYGNMQADTWWEQGEGDAERPSSLESVDMREVAIYRVANGQKFWVRPREEFEDGRFIALEARP